MEAVVNAIGILRHIFFEGKPVKLIIGRASFRGEKDFHFIPCFGIVFIQLDGEHDPVLVAVRIKSGTTELFCIRFGISGKQLLRCCLFPTGKRFNPFRLIFCGGNRCKCDRHHQQQ